MKEKENNRKEPIVGLWALGPADKKQFFHSYHELIKYQKIKTISRKVRKGHQGK